MSVEIRARVDERLDPLVSEGLRTETQAAGCVKTQQFEMERGEINCIES